MSSQSSNRSRVLFVDHSIHQQTGAPGGCQQVLKSKRLADSKTFSSPMHSQKTAMAPHVSLLIFTVVLSKH